MSNRKQKWVLFSLASILIVGCGGGSGSSQITAGIDGTGARSPVAVVSHGTVTGFGSVIVNGVDFDTSAASFLIDGVPGAQSDLAVGDVVTVRGELDDDNSLSGSATEITYDDLVEGPIATIDAMANTLTVLGQTVRVTADTSFDDSIAPPAIDGLTVGDVIEVSGFVASDGSISATRIEPKHAPVGFELTGLVTGLNAGSSEFNINGQLVDYSAAVLTDFGSAPIADGDLVEVKAGTTLGAGGELLATRVEFQGNDINGDDGDRVEIEGFISRFVDITDFDVSGFPVTSNGSPTLEGGLASDLGLDIKVEVEGSLSGGVLNATKIEIRRSSAVRIVANVDSVDSANNFFVVLGIDVTVDELTRLEDKGPLDLESFSLSDLFVGDYVEVRGVELPAGSGVVRASLLERDDDRPDVELRGFVQAGTAISPSFAILGVTVATNGSTVFRDVNDAVIASATFFANADGRLVAVDGIEVGDRAITAAQVEFE